ncbi:hypothetical protein R1sor_010070 [Riccia sorocarpa]|uniref:Fe2OG dioxygenase domain-containing protein n=1 Tax=Riccia sorocarpa TaxID=122646 RepID=A0ABD3HYX2_9MARC
MSLSMGTQGLGPSTLPPATELLASLANIAQRTDSTITNAGLLSVLLQGSKLPEVYVQPEQDRPTNYPDVQSELEVELPAVDLTAFNSLDGPARAEAMSKMVQACETWGFIQVINHGVDLDLTEKCEAEVHRLFQLPVSIKENALRVPGALYGYGANFWLNLPAMNWAESFHVTKHNCKEYAAKLWPSDYERFSSSVEKYIAQVEDLGHRVRRILTEGLGLTPDYFDPYFTEKDTSSSLRMNFYPLCPEPSKALGLKAHRDPHFLTLLHQDATGGLQIWNERKDEWFNVKPRVDSFILNVGDVLQAASNGRYRSVLHRVVVNSYKTRLSMACFFNTSATIVAPPQLLTPENPQRYRPFSWKEYIRTAYTVTTGKDSQLDELYGIQENLPKQREDQR